MTMWLAFLVLMLAVSSLAERRDLSKEELEKIQEKMSREVEGEFSGKEDREELAVLKERFAAAHSGNETFIDIPTELDINVNQTDLFEGDIELTPEQWKIALDYDPANPMRRRQGLTNINNMWQPMGAPVIPYTFADGFPEQQKKVVRDAMAFWEQRSCIKFRVATAADTSAIVYNHISSGCSSYVGRLPSRQSLNLAPGCFTVTIVAHELSHAFGTLHVQSRVDRETYVQIDTANIQKGAEHNFKIEPSYATYGIPYEFGSTQHYFATAFAVTPGRPTIYARPPYERFQGSMDGPRATFWDTVLINKMYKCTDKCAQQMVCKNGGVTDGASCSRCFCPRGWAGNTCDTRPAAARIVHLLMPSSKVTTRLEMNTTLAAFEERLVVVQAPNGRRIEATVNSFGPFNFSMCRSVGLEIIPTQDTRTSGIRICAKPPTAPIVSDGNSMLLWLYRDANYPVAAEVTVRVV